MPAPKEAGAAAKVYYPGRGCETRVLEVEVWRADQEVWSPHPEHPRVVADSCQVEPTALRLHQIRVRCIDPSGQNDPEPWRVGLARSRESGGDRCMDRAAG